MELRESVQKIRETKKELENSLKDTFIKFTERTGLTIYGIQPNAIFKIGEYKEAIEYRPTIEIIIER